MPKRPSGLKVFKPFFHACKISAEKEDTEYEVHEAPDGMGEGGGWFLQGRGGTYQVHASSTYLQSTWVAQVLPRYILDTDTSKKARIK